MKKYKQLTVEQRYQIEVLIQTGFKQTMIANVLGVHRSTISRELKRSIPKRGRGLGEYSASNAQRKCTALHKQKNKRTLLSKHPSKYILLPQDRLACFSIVIKALSLSK